MSGLYPIVRRVRRPLLPVGPTAVPVVPAASPQAAPPEAPVVASEPPPAQVEDVARGAAKVKGKPGGKSSSK